MHVLYKSVIVATVALLVGVITPSPHAKDVTVKLVCKNGDVELGWGSGTIIEGDLILSAAHVIRGCAKSGGKMAIESRPGTPLTLIKIDFSKDLMVLKSKDYLSYAKVEIADVDPELGDALRIWGFPSPHPYLTVTQGIVSSFLDEDDYPRYIVTDTALTFGNSGGGAWDISGRLVGVTSAFAADNGAEDGYRLGLLISASEINEFLKDVL